MKINAIDTRQLTNKRLAARVVHFESPSLFWMRLKDTEEEFIELEEELNIQMEGRINKPYKPHALKVGKVVAIKSNERWQRGLIKRINKVTRMALILLNDIGLQICQPLDEIYFLENKFMKLPWQAIACGLPWIRPLIPTWRWPEDSNKICRLHTEDSEGWIRIIRPLWEGAALIHYDRYCDMRKVHHSMRTFLFRLGLAQQSHELISIPS